MLPSEHRRPQLQRRPRLSAAEVDRLWRAAMPVAHTTALDEALAREPATPTQLALVLAQLDEQTRTTFVRSLAHGLASAEPPAALDRAAGEALGRTRIAAFWTELVRQETTS